MKNEKQKPASTDPASAVIAPQIAAPAPALSDECVAIAKAIERHMRTADEHAIYERYHRAKVDVLGIEFNKADARRAEANRIVPVPPGQVEVVKEGPASFREKTAAERRPPARPGKGENGGLRSEDGPKRRASARPATAPRRQPGGVEDPAKVAGARALPEPFTAAALGVALGIAGTGPNSLLKRWEDKGWVKRGAVRGQWSRTPAFGRKAEAAAQSAQAALLEEMRKKDRSENREVRSENSSLLTPNS